MRPGALIVGIPISLFLWSIIILALNGVLLWLNH